MRRFLVIALTVSALVCVSAAPSVAPFRAQPDAPDDAWPTVAISLRLSELKPENPLDYFLLAEEVAEIAIDPDRERLAKELYILAFELDRGGGRPGPLAASAAIGLAGVERLERDRRWLVALAGAIDRRYALPDWNVAAASSISEELAYNAATVLGMARAGEGRDARKWLDKPGVMQTLRRYERLIGSSGETGALSRLDKYIENWPCQECGNERTVRRVGDRGPELRLCPSCAGNPGPAMPHEEYIAQLRFESALLNGVQRSWGAQLIVDQSAPLRDPDPDELAATYRVDPGKPYWRGGRWSAER
jgi:hypothetical protein